MNRLDESSGTEGNGPAPQVQFATLAGSPNDVDNSDFLVIA